MKYKKALLISVLGILLACGVFLNSCAAAVATAILMDVSTTDSQTAEESEELYGTPDSEIHIDVADDSSGESNDSTENTDTTNTDKVNFF